MKAGLCIGRPSTDNRDALCDYRDYRFYIDKNDSKNGFYGLDEKKIRIVAGSKDLEPEDLRIGHHVHVNEEKDLIQVIGYSPPTRALRLTITIVVKDTEEIKESDHPNRAHWHDIIRTHLSWLLPPDVSFERPSPRHNPALIGHVIARYSSIHTETGWAARRWSTTDTLELETALVDKDRKTTWTRVISSGGSHPGPSDSAYDMVRKSAFVDLPVFKVIGK